VPSSTYRLQLRPEFTFAAAADVVDYLRALGVGAAYLSPVLDAAPGSTHGYDVVDPTRARPALGGADGLHALAARLRTADLGMVVDIVPNHVSVAGPENRWWWDVLTHGRGSAHAGYFDIDWSRERLLLPVLGSAADIAKLTALRAGRLAARQRRAELPAVLRHHDAGRRPGRGPDGLRGDPRRGTGLGGRRRRHRPAGGPSRRPRRSGRLPAPAAGGRAERVAGRGEDPASG
jgi:maltooligosyltrehalose synthase